MFACLFIVSDLISIPQSHQQHGSFGRVKDHGGAEQRHCSMRPGPIPGSQSVCLDITPASLPGRRARSDMDQKGYMAKAERQVVYNLFKHPKGWLA